MNEKIKKCKYCGKDFYYKNDRQIYCSGNCKNYYHNKTKGTIYKKRCKYCNNLFETSNESKIFCDENCRIKYFTINKKQYKYEMICGYCKKKFIKTVDDKNKPKGIYFCSIRCSALNKNKNGINKISKCKFCKKEFSMIHKRHYFCSNQCKSKYGSLHVKMKIVNCSNCDKEINRNKNLSQTDYFCSKKCESEFKIKKSKDIRICKICGKEFFCKTYDDLKMCSIKCQGVWQSRFRSGKNSPSYKFEITKSMREKKCECCGKKMIGTPKSFESKKYCSNSCKNKSIKYSMTKPHIMTCEILRRNNLIFSVEHPVGRFLLDCYLQKHNLGIEVMGSYYHADIRKYDYAINKIQKDSFGRDKRKKKLCESKDLKILYIWEDDIYNDEKMCEKLILKFIRNYGILDNYHSMNYVFQNEILILNKNILIPHFEK